VMELFDTHAHLNLPAFENDLDAVLARAEEAGVRRFICVGVDMDSSRRAVQLARRFPRRALAAVGIHPNDWAGANAESLSALAQLAELPQVAAIGETGLDFHHERTSPEQQEEGFRHHIALARRVGKPLIVHVRKADEAAIAILKEYEGQVSGVRHCFDRPMPTACSYLDLGFHISLAAAITRPGYEKLKRAVRQIPLDRILVETDCPYQSPYSRHSGRNEPAFITDVVGALARLRGLPLAEAAAATTRNAVRLFESR